MTDLQASDTVFKLAEYANTITDGVLMITFVYGFFFIMLMSMKRYEFDKALLVSSTISFVVSIILVYINVVPLLAALGFLIIAAGMLFYMVVVKK